MPLVDRFTVSLDTELLAAFDGYMASRGYVNRSEAIRDLIRDALVATSAADETGEVMAVVTGVCDADVSDAAERLRRRLATRAAHVVTYLNFPLDDRRCIVVIVLRGRIRELQALADGIRAMRGISHAKTSMIPSVLE